eukprot:5664751-Ditylum_brightwellii.AAC.1
MAQSSQDNDHIMPSDDENETSVKPLPRNEDEDTINGCFKEIKMVSCCKHHFMNMLRKFTAENDMGPYQDGFPHHLPKLTKIEEILIVCVNPVMKTYQ